MFCFCTLSFKLDIKRKAKAVTRNKQSTINLLQLLMHSLDPEQSIQRLGPTKSVLYSDKITQDNNSRRGIEAC